MQEPYYIHGSLLSPSLCRIQLMRGNSQFYLTIPFPQVENTPLGQELFLLINRYLSPGGHNMEAYDKLMNLICPHFLPIFGSLARETSICNLTLEDFVHAPTYRLDVFGTDTGTLSIRGQENMFHEPAYDTAPLFISSAPDFWNDIPKSQARDLSLALSVAESNPLRAIQGRVKTAQGSYMYFKPRQAAREEEFTREVQLLYHIKEKGLAGSHYRLPVFDSLVVSDTNGEVVTGILMNLIISPDLGCHLLSPGFKDRVDLHRKWEEQVRTTLQLLHSHDLVWGDVNLCNVAIDEKLDAWIIDFGGMNNAEFVDDDKAETKEGDWQGVERLFARMKLLAL
jgi:serine/threonine protein kinase